MLNIQQITQETVENVAKALVAARQGGLSKATIDLSSGLTGQPLEAPAKLLVPLLAPFRQSIARETVGGSTRAWKKITAVTPPATSGLGVAEGTKAAAYSLTKVDDSTTFRSMGRLGDVTWEGEIAGRNFEDVLARNETLLLLQAMREEELVILGGNRTALGAPASVVVTANTSGGSMADATYFVRVFALTMEAARRVSPIARPTPGTNNYDCTTPPTAATGYGFSAASSQGSGTISGGGGAGSLTITWTAIAKAAAYAVFVSTTTGAGNQKLQCVVPCSKVILTVTNTTGAADPTGGDTTANTLLFDGIMQQLAASGSGAYVQRVNGPLSSATGSQIPQIAAMLSNIYDRTGGYEPDRLVMGWTEADAISQKLIAVANDRLNINISAAEASNGQLPRVQWYMSPRGKRIPIEINPNIPGGVILALVDSVPIPDSQIPAAWKMWMGSDWTRLDYALTAPKYEIEVRAYGALAGYAPAFQGMAYDIQPA